MDQTRKVVTSFTLAPDLLARLCAAAAADERSRSFLAGRAIERFLEMPAPLGLGAPAAVVEDRLASDRGATAETVVSGCESQDRGAQPPFKNSGDLAALPG
jgi:hypothetical protein